MTEAIVVAFNSGRSLLGCCNALLREPDIRRVHIVDNSPGGTDAELLKLAMPQEARIVAVAGGHNRGFGPAVNLALRGIEGDYVAIVNPDGAVESGAIRRLVEALERTPDAVLTGARLVSHDGKEQKGSRRREPTPSRLMVNTIVRALRLRCWYGHGFELSDAPLPPAPVPVDAVSGACMVARTAALRAIGGFDTSFFLHFEDLDLCKRLRDTGGRIVFVPDAVFRHEGGGSSASRPYFVIWHKHRSMIKYYWKHYRRLEQGGALLPLVIAVASGRYLFKMAAGLISVRVRTK